MVAGKRNNNTQPAAAVGRTYRWMDHVVEVRATPEKYWTQLMARRRMGTVCKRWKGQIQREKKKKNSTVMGKEAQRNSNLV